MQPHGRAELIGGGGASVSALMRLLRDDGTGDAGWRDVQSLVLLMIGCLCTEAEGRDLVSAVGACVCIACDFICFYISGHDCFQVVKCEREVGFLLKLMAVAGGDVYLTRYFHRIHVE